MTRMQLFGELGQDATFAGRQLLKTPGFALLAVLTLAVGIGGTTSIFSALYAVVLKPLPLVQPDRLFAVGETYQGQLGPMSAGVYVDAEAGTTAFEGLAAEQYFSFNLSEGGAPERVIGGRVTAPGFAARCPNRVQPISPACCISAILFPVWAQPPLDCGGVEQ